MIGRTISHYRVVEKLGSGGMGEVYRAEDLKLGRSVAVKILPAEFGRDPAALERFEREARLAASLNHPNICTIHEVDEVEGQPFIVMELLEGQTLDRAIGGRPVPLDQLLDVALQVADALDCAHTHGVVHRDIKPSNIFITTRGVPKMLDFGLAKAVAEAQQAPSDATAATLTAPGSVAGTVAYMSPEQARGEPLDPRTDLFSFGAVLYEMATGIQPFKGNTSAIIFAQILTAEPPSVAALNAALPARLEDVIGKALEKDRALRYQSAADIRADLQRIKRDISSGRPAAAPVTAAAPRSRAKTKWALAATAVAIVFAVIVAVVWWPRSRAPQTPKELKLTRLTANPVDLPVLSAALSPDAKYLAFVDASGLYLQLVKTGERHTLRAEGVLWPTSWFPDGTRFVGMADAPQREAVMVVPILGGGARKVRDNAVLPVVSPDGSRIAYQAGKDFREVWVMGAGGEDARQLAGVNAPDQLGRIQWSPDSRRLAYAVTRPGTGSIRTADVASGSATTLVEGHELGGMFHIAWLPGGRLIYALADAGSNGQNWNLWQLDVDSASGQAAGPARKLTNWAGFIAGDLSASADGSRMAFIKTVYQADVYVGDLQAGGTRLSTPRRLTLDERNDRAGCWTPDSRAVVFASDRGGTLDIYKQDVDKTTPELLVGSPADDYGPRLSPDGQWVLYMTAKAGTGGQTPRVMRVPVGGGSPEAVLTPRTANVNFRCSLPPGNLCILLERDGNRTTVTGFDAVQGRGKELFTVDFSVGPVDVCPSGECILMALTREEQNRVGIFSLDGAMQRSFDVGGVEAVRGLDAGPDGRSIFVGSWKPETGGVVVRSDLQGRSRQLWQQKGSLNAYGIPSPDGRRVALLGTTAERNVWLAENF